VSCARRRSALRRNGRNRIRRIAHRGRGRL
jgi:hypothetical protein